MQFRISILIESLKKSLLPRISYQFQLRSLSRLCYTLCSINARTRCAESLSRVSCKICCTSTDSLDKHVLAYNVVSYPVVPIIVCTRVYRLRVHANTRGVCQGRNYYCIIVNKSWRAMEVIRLFSIQLLDSIILTRRNTRLYYGRC